jgi:hypothetical protein
MEVRDAVEADAEALAALADAPADVMRNLVHDRTVRVAEAGEEAAGAGTDGDDAHPGDVDGDAGDDGASAPPIAGFVSFDASEASVHVTQLAGSREACERLLAEPVRFGHNEGLPVECLVAEDEAAVRDAVEAAGFVESGAGPRFDGRPTVRYRLDTGAEPDLA